MKKKLLSLALVLVMALVLLPTAALAADDAGAPENAPVCLHLDGCVGDQHDPLCPLYVAPQPAPEQQPEPEPQPEPEQQPEPEPADGGNNDELTEPPAQQPNQLPEQSNQLLNQDPPAIDGGNNEQTVTPPTTTPPVDEEENNEQTEQTKQPETKEGGQNVTPPTTAAADPNPHTPAKTVPAEAATCTKAGNMAYYTCAKCSKVFSDEELTTEILTGVTIPALGHNYVNGYCTRCKAKNPDTTQTHTHAPTFVAAKEANCTEAGNRPHYACVCGELYSSDNLTDPNTIKYTRDQVVIPAKGHTPPASTDFNPADITSTTHSYTCTVCHAGDKITERHDYESGVCKVCGFPQPSGGSVTPSYRYINISSVYVNSYSISVTWYSDFSEGTYFDIYVDGNFCNSVAPSKSSSGYFSYAVDFSHYLEDRYYDVTVRLSGDASIYDSERVYNRYYDHDYWYDHYYPSYPNSTPSTNSSGIPYASQVNGRYSASEAIRILRNKNQSNLQYDLLNSNSVSNSFYDLEQAVKRVNNVDVRVDIDRSDVPSAIRNIQIVGAAFNASSTNSTVRLVVDAPAWGRYSGHGYQFSMSLTGVGNDSSLDVPVKITMPVPSGINSNYVRILHYHGSGAPAVIEPKVSGSSMSFTLTGFSDFVITDNRVDPYYYYYTPGIPASARRDIMQEHLAVVLPILANMPTNGYVFDDVGPGHWAASAIAWARDGGMMTGYYDGTFRPYAATTRQELWMVLARLAGARPADMWDARQWAINTGISDGRNPHSPLSVQQMISMLYRYAQYLGVDVSPQASLRGYRDTAAISGYARNAMAWAVDQGIVVADASNRLNPQNIATRADFAVFLYRFVL